MKTRNNTINPRRLARLFIYENKSSNYIQKITLFSIVFTAYILLNRFLKDTAGIETTANKNIFEDFITLFAIIFSPFIFYHKLFKKKYCLQYIMLPASNTEKYLSLLANTLITAPITIIAITGCINYIASGFSANYTFTLFSINTTSSIIENITLISFNTFLLIILTQYNTLKTIGIIILLSIIFIIFNEQLYFAVNLFDYFGFTRIIVFQALIYYQIKKLKA